MATILYPTRGGESAYKNQDIAVELAKQRQAQLLLLYVSNVRFLDHIASRARLDLIEAELDELGEFLLAMAQERAEKDGVQTKTAVRHGAFVDALLEVIDEYDVQVVVLGGPSQDTGVTNIEYILGIAQHIHEKTGVEALVVQDGTILSNLHQASENNS